MYIMEALIVPQWSVNVNPFDFLNDINYGKNNIMVDDLTEKAYA